jgi:GT2 family glycosyltransferase
MKISAIVPVWNGRDLLARLLASLEAQTRPVAELLIVDNGSTDGAGALARDRGARVIAMGRNAGFAAAVNRGIREACHPLVAIFNSDVEPAPDYLEKLGAADAPFATGKIFSPTGLLDASFDMTCRGGTTWRSGAGQRDSPPFDQSREITSPPWTAVLYRAEVFRQVGYLEESFESYLEDVDFGLRCAARGIAGRYVPEARAVHVGSASLGRWHADTVRRMARNQVLLAARYGCHLWPAVVAQLLWGGVALRHGRGWAWARGKVEGVRLFSAARAEMRALPHGRGSDHVELLEEALRSNERFIYAHSRDLYWRLYFLLTGGAK